MEDLTLAHAPRLRESVRPDGIKRTISTKGIRPSLQKPTYAIKYQVVSGIGVRGMLPLQKGFFRQALGLESSLILSVAIAVGPARWKRESCCG
jgi:hypothetical protein